MFKVPERFRNLKGMYSSTQQNGNNGWFVIPHHRIVGYVYTVMASDGDGWEHVSVSVRPGVKSKATRCPTWEEMCYIKDLFWDPFDWVMQFHPSIDEYVNAHPFTLHLWCPIGNAFPTPPTIMVGPKTS